MSIFKDQEITLLVHWIHEREHIRREKAAQRPKPWTSDVMMRNTRWCNVRRLDDAVSCSLFAYWYDDKTQSQAEQFVAAALARLINWPPTLMSISECKPWRDSMWFMAKLAVHARCSEVHKVFTGAYIIPGVPGMSKVDSVFNAVKEIRARSDMMNAGTMHDTWQCLMCVESIGPFIAGQIVADLAHLNVGRSWSDRNEWAPLGPGSNRGMNRLLGRPKDRRMTQVEFHELLRLLIVELRPHISSIWMDRKLQAFDIQNCLCEFDKYRRLLLGEGTVRQSYDGEAKQGLLP